MRTVGVFEAKNRLTALLDEVEEGGEVVITRRGKPVARLVPVDVGYDRAEIVAAVRAQIAHGSYASDHLYGDGRAGGRIASVLAEAPLSVQKRLMY